MDGSVRTKFGWRDRSFIVITDPVVGEHTHEERAQLRTIPFLLKLGVENVAHTSLWDNDFKLVDYNHMDPQETNPSEVDFPLAHIVSQDGLASDDRWHDEQYFARKVLQQKTDDDTYILVTDTRSPSTPAYTRNKSLVDEFGPCVKDYVSVAERYLDNLDSGIPWSDTKNLFYHEVSDHHKELGAPSRTLPEIFDYSKAPPDSPVWDPLYYFVEEDLERILDRYTERIREALRSWTERGDVQKVANNMDIALTECDFRSEKIDEKRERNEKLYQ